MSTLDHDPDALETMRKIAQAEGRAAALFDRWEAAKEAAKSAKDEYEDAIAIMRALIRESTKTYPLFDHAGGEVAE